MRSPTELGYGARPDNLFPLVRGILDPSQISPEFLAFAGDSELPPVPEHAAEPFVGLTSDGAPAPGLFSLRDEGLDTKPIKAAADELLARVTDEQRAALLQPVDSDAWRMWTNAYPAWEPSGLRLEDLTDDQREAAMAVVELSLSAHGFETTRNVMKLNGALGELIDQYHDTLTEWMYWFVLFGTPSTDEPWGWQIMGHHLDVNCFLLGSQMVLTPTFMGTEPSWADHGTYAGVRALDAERTNAMQLYEALSGAARDKATLYPSMLSADLPKPLAGPIDGRHRAGAARDNLVLPYEGVRADDLSAGQQELLLASMTPYLSRLPAGPFEAKVAEVTRHLDDTWFAWIGPPPTDDTPFYYKVHSPVVLIEYDHHPGVFLNNDEPEPFHVHTIVRTPNGNDYGRDLLRLHYEQFPHRPHSH